ncbi:alpha/beta fold hydrolase [Paenibacillus flagellatus]|uniref:Alpha/beta hydrolase n=1 Tax=Paenibacillus flagellatus TaxID=2211139 RepID=A0A2V5JWG1_9BACL|nr:alpha/beta hydrolase [Paenibacillus flagellatus]PYI50522.1 alpha/beta hydrolase [Paenibacillus flagellatus]
MESIYRKPEYEDVYVRAYDRTLSEWSVPYETFYVRTSFGETHVIAAGPKEGKPLVLLHGFGFGSTHWIDNIAALSESRRVYALDFAGDTNKSKATKRIATREEGAAWFAETLDGLGLEVPDVIGLSYGGFLALLFAIALPERVGRIAAISPGASLRPQSKRFFFRCMMAGFFPSAKRIERLMDYMTGPGHTINRTVKDQFVVTMQTCLPRIRLFAGTFTDEELGRIRCPALILVGEHEVQYDAAQAVARAEAVIPGVRTVLVPGAGHGLPMECPELVNELLLDFLHESAAARKHA